MLIFNENWEVIENPNLELGRILDVERYVTYRYQIEKEEVGHYEVVTEYPNGGKDLAWVIDSPEEGQWLAYDINGCEIQTEYAVPDDMPHELELNNVEIVSQYVLYTEEELAAMALAEEEAQAALAAAEAAANEPSQLDILEAQVTYTAMMTDTLLEV